MEQLTATESIAAVIQLAVAPVFLLAGIAGMLNVLSTRLGRVVDRVRAIEAKIVRETHQDHTLILQTEIRGLWQRIALVNWSIRMFVSGALLISLVIVALFFGELVVLNLSITIAVLFLGAMFMLITGLILFLFEVSISTRLINDGITQILHEDDVH